jgi:hypothetical protein
MRNFRSRPDHNEFRCLCLSAGSLNTQIGWANTNGSPKPQYRDTALLDHPMDLPFADLANVRRLGHGEKAVTCVEAYWQITIARASRAVEPRFGIAAFPPIDSRSPAAAWGNHDENSAGFARRAPRGPELSIDPGIQVRWIVDRLAPEFSVRGAAADHSEFAERLGRDPQPHFREIFGRLILVEVSPLSGLPKCFVVGYPGFNTGHAPLPPTVAARSRKVTAVSYSANPGVKRWGISTFLVTRVAENGRRSAR